MSQRAPEHPDDKNGSARVQRRCVSYQWHVPSRIRSIILRFAFSVASDLVPDTHTRTQSPDTPPPVSTMLSFPSNTKTILVATAVIAALAFAPAADACATAPYGKCGSNDGTTCCPSNFYCQPWDAGFFQCLPVPSRCPTQLTNVDLYGNDIKTVYGIQPSACCDECKNTPGCVAYTFVNSNPGQPACYLKRGVGERRSLVGAVSGIIDNAPPQPPTSSPTPSTTAPAPQPPTPACSTPAYSSCGSSAGTTCCPNGFFCQPWNPGFYQCIPTPPQCREQLTDTDFYGNDIKTVYVSLPSLCCDECAKTPGCKAYTYVNNNPGQPACYLKSAAGATSRLVGAVSARMN
ncbi:hypothetical protein PINS_up002430 [Pythium insidiosum]|nr:hypothetical protein PINS_up002430 [Pythium insidiosum]